MTEEGDLRNVRRRYFGEVVKKWRQEAKLTQGAVAAELGYTSPQFVSNWERGVSMPPMDALPVICKLYGVPPRRMLNVIMEYQEQSNVLQKRHLRKVLNIG